MEVISDLDALAAEIAECNDVLTQRGDEAMRHFFQTFRGDFSGQAPMDPFSPAYRAFQMRLHEHICGKTYSPHDKPPRGAPSGMLYQLPW